MNLEELQAAVNKELNSDLLTSLKPGEAATVSSGLSSGSLMLNQALSGNPLVGYQWGRIAEVYGPESGGKTTLALHAVYEAQRLEDASGTGVPVLFVDAEHAVDPTYAYQIGIDLDRMTVAQPDTGEQGLDAVIKGIEKGYKLVVVDSVAALSPKAEIEGDMGDQHVGLQGRMMGQALRKVTPLASSHKAIVIFINQIRMKVGVMFGNPETTPGGKALKFFASYRLEVRSPRGGAKKKKSLSAYGKEEEYEASIGVNVKVVKNKAYAPFRTASFRINYGEGVDRFLDAVEFLRYAGVFDEGKKLYLPSKDKEYTDKGLLKVIVDDPEVQADVAAKVKEYS